MRSEQRSPAALADDAPSAAKHVVEVARTLVAMGRMATLISSCMRATPDEAALIRRFLPELAARYGITAEIEDNSGTLTVTFARRSP